jgi:heat shock protein HslJ
MEVFMNINVIKTIMMITLILFSAILSYADDISIANNVLFSKIKRIDWNLAKVKSRTATVIIDRSKAQREIYSIRFQEDRIRGRGADNIYSAPYSLGVNNSISIQRITSTYMVPIFEMENFRETEFFQYLERVNRWEFHDWKMILHTQDENGTEVILKFIPIYK